MYLEGANYDLPQHLLGKIDESHCNDRRRMVAVWSPTVQAYNLTVAALFSFCRILCT
jgi:hypothetical protein